MSRRAVFLSIALAVLAAAVAYDFSLRTKFVAARETDAELARRFGEIEKEVRFQVQQNQLGHAAENSEGPSLARAKINKSATEAVGLSAAKAEEDPRQLIVGDASLRSKYLINYRDGLDTQYGLFIHMLGLSPADEAEFKRLMTDREAKQLEVAEAAAARGLDTDDPEMKTAWKQFNRANMTSLKQLLGPDGMTALKQYWSEWPVVTLVQNFGGNLAEPTLTMNQAQQLVTALSAASQRDAKGTVLPDTVNVQQALKAAGPILTQEQFLILSATLRQAEAKAKISQLEKSVTR